jgi:hypothetical protein
MSPQQKTYTIIKMLNYLREHQKKSIKPNDYSNNKILINLIKINFKPICMGYVWI